MGRARVQGGPPAVTSRPAVAEHVRRSRPHSASRIDHGDIGTDPQPLGTFLRSPLEHISTIPKTSVRISLSLPTRDRAGLVPASAVSTSISRRTAVSLLLVLSVSRPGRRRTLIVSAGRTAAVRRCTVRVVVATLVSTTTALVMTGSGEAIVVLLMVTSARVPIIVTPTAVRRRTVSLDRLAVVVVPAVPLTSGLTTVSRMLRLTVRGRTALESLGLPAVLAVVVVVIRRSAVRRLRSLVARVLSRRSVVATTARVVIRRRAVRSLALMSLALVPAGLDRRSHATVIHASPCGSPTGRTGPESLIPRHLAAHDILSSVQDGRSGLQRASCRQLPNLDRPSTLSKAHDMHILLSCETLQTTPGDRAVNVSVLARATDPDVLVVLDRVHRESLDDLALVMTLSLEPYCAASLGVSYDAETDSRRDDLH